MKNILSIDLESWVHLYIDVLKSGKELSSEDRKKLDNGYIKHSVLELLEILEYHGHTATFFVVSELYDWHPEVIDEIKEKGHEIAYHTHTHAILKNNKIVAEELANSKKFIEHFKPKGFRAPQIYITRDSYPLFKKNGFTYSSSSYNIHKLEKLDGVLEIPVSTIMNKNKQKKFPKNFEVKEFFRILPFGSGLYFVFFRSFMTVMIKYVNRKNNPAIIFVHPWQLFQFDPPRKLHFKIKLLIHHPLYLPYLLNIKKPFNKVLSNHKFVSFEKYYFDLL